jgi:hypothetical protein
MDTGRCRMKTIVVTDQLAGTAGMTLAETATGSASSWVSVSHVGKMTGSGPVGERAASSATEAPTPVTSPATLAPLPADPRGRRRGGDRWVRRSGREQTARRASHRSWGPRRPRVSRHLWGVEEWRSGRTRRCTATRAAAASTTGFHARFHDRCWRQRPRRNGRRPTLRTWTW